MGGVLFIRGLGRTSQKNISKLVEFKQMSLEPHILALGDVHTLCQALEGGR